MKLVLNEFIIDRAAGGPDQQLSILQLVQAINIKNHVVVLTPNLIARYYKKIKKYEKSMQKLPKAIKAFISLIQDSTKVFWVEQLRNFDLPETLEDDRDIIAAAVSCESTKLLVTTDGGLIEFLKEESIATEYNIEVVKPQKALEMLTR